MALEIAGRRRAGWSATEAAAVLALLVGALLLQLPGQRYRVDALFCPAWPPLQANLGFAVIYLIAIGLLGWGWWRYPAVSFSRTLATGLLVHGLALMCPPFLSHDPLYYAATGRVLARLGGAAALPINQVLSAGDPFLTSLPEAWRSGSSAYLGGFDRLCRLVALVGREDLAVHLRLHQLVACASVVLASVLGALAVAPPRRARALGLSLLCPLGVIEATVGAHNDALLALAAGAFVLALARGRAGLGFIGLLGGLAVKLSALLLLGLDAGMRLVAALRRRLGDYGPGRESALLGLLVLLGLVAALLLRRVPALLSFSRLLGAPEDAYDYCTRSIECLPRVLLRFVLHSGTAAWFVGLLFRGAGALWLGWVVLRGSRSQERLGWAAIGLFYYYLYLHGWAQSWYLLPLVPLLPHAPARVLPAMRAFCVSGVAYYVTTPVISCVTDPIGIALGDLVGAVITIIPPSVATVRMLRAERAPRVTQQAARPQDTA